MGGQQKIPSQRQGWKGYFRQAAPFSRLRGSWTQQLPPTVDRLDLAEGYSSGRSQVSSEASPSIWRASSSLNLAP